MPESQELQEASMEPIHVHQWDYDGVCEGCLMDIREALAAAEQTAHKLLGIEREFTKLRHSAESTAEARLAAEQQAQALRAALEDLYAAYCAEMQSEHDYPGKPWTPDRDNDAAALKARAALNPQSAADE